MTRDEILAMEPGRELDARVAEKVLRWTHIGEIGDSRQTILGYPEKTGGCAELPHYSTDLSAAWWEVVEKITSKGYDLKLHCVPLVVNKLFDCTINNNDVELAHVAMKSTAPEAICKAALIAVLNTDSTAE